MAGKKQKRTSNNPAGRPQSDELTLRIHSALFGMLIENGYKTISMEAVANRAAVSRPALYRRYANIARLTLGALQEAGSASVIMNRTSDLRSDLETYLAGLVAALAFDSPVGKAFRGVFSEALANPQFGGEFVNLIEKRRRPVAIRLKAGDSFRTDEQIENALDHLFGPILYRLLMRGMPVSDAHIRVTVDAMLCVSP